MRPKKVLLAASYILVFLVNPVESTEKFIKQLVNI